MSEFNLQKAKQVAIEASRSSAEVMKGYFASKEKSLGYKEGREMTTNADFASENDIVDHLERFFPEYNILTEEKRTVNRGSEFTWIIDPLDGTTNFYYGLPIWGSSIALYKNAEGASVQNDPANGHSFEHKDNNVAREGEILLGVINLPLYDQLFVAAKGGGAYMNEVRLRVSDRNKLEDLFGIWESLSFKTELDQMYKALIKVTQRIYQFRYLGSAVYHFAYTAAGITDFVNVPINRVWDTSAGVLMVREAGGKVTNYAGAEYSLADRSLLASSGKLHQELLKIINS